jgi:hypothetical protein
VDRSKISAGDVGKYDIEFELTDDQYWMSFSKSMYKMSVFISFTPKPAPEKPIVDPQAYEDL